MTPTPSVTSGAQLELRHRQKEAVDAAVFALETPPGGIPAEGLRTQVIAAPGSGKTLVAYEVARRLEPGGRVLVLVPTLNLLVQTVAKWRQYGMRGTAVAVCSLDRDPQVRAYLADDLDVRCTTNPIRLGLWAGTGPVTVFATYDSLVGNPGRTGNGETEAEEEEEAVEQRAVAGVLERALAGAFGQKLDGFGLAIVDEAHRTAGLATKPWAIIHDNTRIPAGRRLYMTATPRIWEAGDTTGAEGEDGEVLVASMDDETVYGKPAFTYPLGQAIEEGVLASFEIDVLEIRDPAPPGDSTSLEERRGARLGAIRAATLAHMETAGVVSLLSFHSRTQEALSFARGLPDAADELRAAGRFPGEVWGEWLCGLHPASHQRAVLGQIANGVDAEGHKTEFRILSTCRLLGEGTDITGRCGLDGVLFADVRRSPVDIVQSVGRALRQAPHEGKVARLVVPVLLAEEDEGRDMAATAAFEPLVTVLRALRSFDPRIIEHLTLRPAGRRRGTPEDTVAADPAGDPRQQPEAADGAEGAEPVDDHGPEETGSGDGVELALLRFSRRGRDAEEIARLVRTRVLRPESTAWLTGLEAVRTYASEHGHANIPYTAHVDLGDQALDYPVGPWASEQRRAWRHGDLADWRIELLAETGFVFDPRDQAFTEFLDVCALYFAEHHTLAAPRDAVLAGVAFGERLHAARKPGGLGKKRAKARRERLEAIDPDWNPDWPVAWQRFYAKVRWLLAQGATLSELQPGVGLGGDDIGTWLAQQPAAWHTLTPGQQERLAEIGVAPTAQPELVVTVVPAGASRWEINLAAARQFKAREGHMRVPRSHIETVTDTDRREHAIKLGVFRSNTRSHHNKQKLTPGQTHEARDAGLLG
ncbi:Helicase associated domain protein [Streptomyces sp. NBC_01187]|uniref:DEAD/DEAH box helicase n=1 Tax=Streptomyces sp. NBC_01187 TaxID=2903766 RepID=UPI002F91146F|nr:Helicase associated domain protein [Streptomyces sp. NBC_01187]